jgi:twinkle protein
MDIAPRGLTEETCRKFGYKVNTEEGCQIAEYRDETGQEVVAQKIRRAGKSFSWNGSGNKAGLFGQHLFNGGKSVVVTEGELDCMAVSQSFGNKYPVLSLQNGAGGSVKSCERAYEWLLQFDKVYLCFDMDEPGQEATQAVAAMLPAGKVYTMKLPLKDACETLVKLGTAPIVAAYWNASQWRPEGIVEGNSITKESLKVISTPGYSLPYPRLQEMLRGIRKGELTLLAAGSGVGKTSFAREIAYHLHQTHGLHIANVYLEESKEETAKGYIALHNNVPLGDIIVNPDVLSDKQWDDAIENIVHTRMVFFDHFGSLDSKVLLAKLRYMAVVLKVDFIVLDHISIVISGNTSSGEGERRDIDILMTNLKTLTANTGVGIIAIVHLNQPDGKPHEEGGRVTLSNLRGSGALKQLSNNVIGLERDQQGDDGHNTTVRLLKNRLFGTLGPADGLTYDEKTGRMNVSAASKFASEEL